MQNKENQHSADDASVSEQLAPVNLSGVAGVKPLLKKLPKPIEHQTLLSIMGANSRSVEWNVRVHNAVALRDAIRANMLKRKVRFVISDFALEVVTKAMIELADKLGIPEDERGQL
jgi:hypothetical protein